MSRDETATKLAREATAARGLLQELSTDDADFEHDVVEGETSLLEAIDAALLEMDECDVIVSGCKSVEATIEARRKKSEDRKARIRGLIEQAMVIAGLDTAKRPTATVTVRTVKPKLIVTDEALVPSDFWRQPDPVLDKSKLNKLEAPVAGTTLTNGGTSLQIRRV